MRKSDLPDAMRSLPRVEGASILRRFGKGTIPTSLAALYMASYLRSKIDPYVTPHDLSALPDPASE